ncbi:MAG: S41 family peptidase [Caldilineaceae bacterium]
MLSVQLWERMMRALNQNGVPGLIIDMRQNTGGSGFLADQMAAYFFDEPLGTGQHRLL